MKYTKNLAITLGITLSSFIYSQKIISKPNYVVMSEYKSLELYNYIDSQL